MPKITKNQKIQRAKVVKGKLYSPLAAARLAQEISVANFDETLEVHLRLGIDTRQADQQVRGSITLPNGIGKTVRVAVFAEGEKAREAEAAGADVIGSDDLIAQIQGGFLGFDAAVATPDMMAKVGRLGRILGTRGLMPNPKLGTVTNDVTRIVGELKAGRVEYRADRYGICHVPVGKLSFPAEMLVENYATLLEEIIRVKPAASKGRYLKTITFASSMGPGISVDTSRTRNLLVEDTEE